MNPRSTRVTVALAALLLSALPALAQGRRYVPERESAFRFRVGSFLPEGDSQYWLDKEEDFTGSTEDFENPSFGIDFLLPLSNRLSVQFSGSGYGGEATNAYRDFEDNFGDRIRHDTTLAIASGTAGLVLHLTGPDVAVQPYLGGGVGAYAWEARRVRRFHRLRQLLADHLLRRPDVRRRRLRLLLAGGPRGAHHAARLPLRRGPLDPCRGRPRRRLRRLRQARPQWPRFRGRHLLEPVTFPIHFP